MKVAKAKGRLRGKQLKLEPAQEAHLVGLWRDGGHQCRARRPVRCSPLDGLPRDQTCRRSRRGDCCTVNSRGLDESNGRLRPGPRARSRLLAVAMHDKAPAT